MPMMLYLESNAEIVGWFYNYKSIGENAIVLLNKSKLELYHIMYNLFDTICNSIIIK